MKNHGLKFALVCILVVCLTMSAYAYVQSKVISYPGIIIRVDGGIRIPQDVNGVQVNPFVIDGTTYLPVRAVASFFGLTVEWEQETQTIYLTGDSEGYHSSYLPDSYYTPAGTSAASSTYTRIANLDYSGISIVINGEKLIPKDANGKEVAPFKIDGTTYLPVRAIANALNIGVEWEPDTKTIRLTSPESDYIFITNSRKTDTGNIEIHTYTSIWIP